MPVLAFSTSLRHLEPSAETIGKRTLIQVSRAAFGVMRPRLERDGSILATKNIDAPQDLLSARECGIEPALVIEALKREDVVHATFV